MDITTIRWQARVTLNCRVHALMPLMLWPLLWPVSCRHLQECRIALLLYYFQQIWFFAKSHTQMLHWWLLWRKSRPFLQLLVWCEQAENVWLLVARKGLLVGMSWRMHFPANSRRQEPELQNILIHFDIYSSIGIVAMHYFAQLQLQQWVCVKLGKLKTSSINISKYALHIDSVSNIDSKSYHNLYIIIMLIVVFKSLPMHRCIQILVRIVELEIETNFEKRMVSLAICVNHKKQDPMV